MAQMKYRNKGRQLKTGLRISHYRKLKGMTQEELAEKLNKKPAFVRAIDVPDTGRTISLGTLLDIADSLDVPPQKLLEFEVCSNRDKKGLSIKKGASEKTQAQPPHQSPAATASPQGEALKRQKINTLRSPFLKERCLRLPVACVERA